MARWLPGSRPLPGIEAARSIEGEDSRTVLRLPAMSGNGLALFHEVSLGNFSSGLPRGFMVGVWRIGTGKSKATAIASRQAMPWQ